MEVCTAAILSSVRPSQLPPAGLAGPAKGLRRGKFASATGSPRAGHRVAPPRMQRRRRWAASPTQPGTGWRPDRGLGKLGGVGQVELGWEAWGARHRGERCVERVLSRECYGGDCAWMAGRVRSVLGRRPMDGRRGAMGEIARTMDGRACVVGGVAGHGGCVARLGCRVEVNELPRTQWEKTVEAPLEGLV